MDEQLRAKSRAADARCFIGGNAADGRHPAVFCRTAQTSSRVNVWLRALIRNAKMPYNAKHPEATMIPPSLKPQDTREEFQAIPDADLSKFDDAALEHALKTVNWHPQDVAQFLRATASR